MSIKSFDSLESMSRGVRAEKPKTQPSSFNLYTDLDFFLPTESELTPHELRKTRAWKAGAGWLSDKAITRMFSGKSQEPPKSIEKTTGATSSKEERPLSA